MDISDLYKVEDLPDNVLELLVWMHQEMVDHYLDCLKSDEYVALDSIIVFSSANVSFHVNAKMVLLAELQVRNINKNS